MGAQLTWEPPPKEALEGREGWLLEMHVNIEDLLQGQDGKRMQDTRALVFDGASGVGKTFGALKLSEHLPQDPARDLADIVPRDFAIPPRTYDLHSVYIGFNVDAGLTVHERSLLRSSRHGAALAALVQRIVPDCASRSPKTPSSSGAAPAKRGLPTSARFWNRTPSSWESVSQVTLRGTCSTQCSGAQPGARRPAAGATVSCPRRHR